MIKKKSKTMRQQINESTVKPALLSRIDAAKYLAISTRKLDNLSTQGVIIRKHIDRKTVFLVKDLDSFINLL